MQCCDDQNADRILKILWRDFSDLTHQHFTTMVWSRLFFPSLALVQKNRWPQSPYAATGIPENAHTAGGAPTRDDTHAVARSPRRMRADEPAVSSYYMQFLTSDACSTRIYLCYPLNPTDEAVVWLCRHLPMPMHGLRHIADLLHLHHRFVTLLRQDVPFQWSIRAGITGRRRYKYRFAHFRLPRPLDRLLP